MKKYIISAYDIQSDIIRILMKESNKKRALKYFNFLVNTVGNSRTDVNKMSDGVLKYGSITTKDLITFEII